MHFWSNYGLTSLLLVCCLAQITYQRGHLCGPSGVPGRSWQLLAASLPSRSPTSPPHTAYARVATTLLRLREFTAWPRYLESTSFQGTPARRTWQFVFPILQQSFAYVTSPPG